MLELRPNCECCDKSLPPESTEARICSFECTFCASCADAVLGGKCPNCGGELVVRPRRPPDKLADNPPSAQRVYNPNGGKGTHNVSSDRGKLFPGIGPKSGEMLRAAGIGSLQQLREIGSVRAFVMVKRANGKPSLSFLWGLESLVTGEHWRDVARNHRASLLLALEEAEKMDHTRANG